MDVVEQGPRLAASVLSWGHVTLFSNNSLNCSAQVGGAAVHPTLQGLAVLEELGVPPPCPQAFPTGQQ